MLTYERIKEIRALHNFLIISYLKEIKKEKSKSILHENGTFK